MNHPQRRDTPLPASDPGVPCPAGRVIEPMSLELHSLPGAAAVGIGATLIMDFWNLFLKRAFGIPSLHYGLLGRWLRHMADGTFRHASIAAAAPKPREVAVGWMAHYSIGVAFALVFVVLAPDGWWSRPTLRPALLYGIATVVFPYFLMQPALGLGLASARTPHPARARLKSLATHSVFGIGLYLCALALSQASR
jgi:hypothetical protein